MLQSCGVMKGHFFTVPGGMRRAEGSGAAMRKQLSGFMSTKGKLMVKRKIKLSGDSSCHSSGAKILPPVPPVRRGPQLPPRNGGKPY
eukprot:s135_g16.t1